MRAIIIAEAGVNHNGDPSMAIELIDAASDAGADFIKFQTFSAKNQVTKYAKKANYQTFTTDPSETHYQMLERLELTKSMHYKFLEHCKSRNIGFLSSCFDIESLDLLLDIGQDYFKVPSGEITNLLYLRHLASFRKNVILSTGMSSISDIESAIKVLENGGTDKSKITVLHCTTEYPAPMSEINLRAMNAIGDKFGVTVGYSDHTIGIEVAIAAVALGAKVIEKHFTLNCALEGPDHRASLEPEIFKRMVSAIRNIEVAMGNDIKTPTPSEVRNALVARKSIVANCCIKAGQKFSEHNLAIKRPGSGISPMQWDDVIGKTATRDFITDELIEL